MLTGTSKDC